MQRLNQSGSLIAPFILVTLLLVVSVGFGYWAYTGRADYKNNVDAKIAEAVEVAEAETIRIKDLEFAAKEKEPYKTYQGPDAYGRLNISYPKTWSGYVNEDGSAQAELMGWFFPDLVPPTNSNVNFAFRFEVNKRSFDEVIKSYETSARQGKVRIVAYRLPSLTSVLGVRIVGELATKKQGELVLLPLRDKTIRIWTEGDSFRSDFDKILETFSFIP